MCEGVLPAENGRRRQQLCTDEPLIKPSAFEHPEIAPPAATGDETAESGSEPTANTAEVVVIDQGGKMNDVPCATTGCLNEGPSETKAVTMEPGVDASESDSRTASGRRSRRNSKRLSGRTLDNQSAHNGDLDLEDVAIGVLSPADFRSQPPAAGSVVVDYDEGVPERSRTALLRDGGEVKGSECAPDACDPLNVCATEESFDRLRPRLDSMSAPRTPSSVRQRAVQRVSSSKELQISEPSTTSKEEEDAESVVERCSKLHKLCLCEVQLHKSVESCWLVANGSVYDVTGMLSIHPAGPRSILRKAGGTDCTKDMKFHSKTARKMLDKCFIGKLEVCGDGPDKEPPACTIM